MQVAHDELHDRKRAAGGEAGRPDLDHAAPADLRGDQPERDDEREDRQLAADHRAELVQIEPRERSHGDERNAERSERDRRGIADQRELGGFERLEAEPDHQPAADRHRRAEAGRALDEGAERERDHQRLDAAVARDAGDLLLQDDELARFNRELVDEDRVHDQPADREQAERGPVASRGHGELGRHAVDGHRDDAGGQQRDAGGDVRAYVPEREQRHQHDDGDRGDQRRDADTAEGSVDLGPRHAWMESAWKGSAF